MLGHITYLSETSMRNKFGRRYRESGGRPGFHLGVDFEVESYLQYQGQSFVARFDANSYLYITRAMDYYDAADRGKGDLDKACSNAKAKFLLVSFSSDWLYTPEQMKELTFALYRNKKHVSYVDIPSTYGHDAFLLEVDQLTHYIQIFKGRRCLWCIRLTRNVDGITRLYLTLSQTMFQYRIWAVETEIY